MQEIHQYHLQAKERYNPFTKDGKTRPGDRTPTSASQTTGP